MVLPLSHVLMYSCTHVSHHLLLLVPGTHGITGVTGCCAAKAR
jgi:hypothetical protein